MRTTVRQSRTGRAVGRMAGAAALCVVLTLVALAGCGRPSAPTVKVSSADNPPLYSAHPESPVVGPVYDKVMVIAEENEPDSAVIGSPSAPYINRLAATYGLATNMQAGYPVGCPSLAAYILLTSGGQQGICDDNPPADHQLSVDNIFHQVATAGLQWREYAESMSQNCQQVNSSNELFLVRHVPPPYYTTEKSRCPSWAVPLGTRTTGALHSALASGLPSYSFVTPNACDDMHGAPSCTSGTVSGGDAWLSSWMPQILASSDFQQERLVVVITWDEGSSTTNHVATIVVAPTVRGVTSSAALTHCSTLRAAEEVLHLPLLGCAAKAVSLRTAFHF